MAVRNSNKPNHPLVLSAARTPVGRMQGALSAVPAAELGAAAVRAAVARAALPDLSEIDEVFMGNVVSAGLGQNIARQVAIIGGLPATVGASAINKVCGASLKAVMLAAQAIRAGDSNLFVVGGVESMSQAPHLVDGRSGQLRYGNAEPVCPLLRASGHFWLSPSAPAHRQRLLRQLSRVSLQ